MIGDKSIFSFFTPRNRGYISYGDNKKGKIIGTCTIVNFSNPTIKEVLSLKHNMLSISHLCDKDNNIMFDSSGSRIIKSKSNEIILTNSTSGNIYTTNLNKIS